MPDALGYLLIIVGLAGVRTRNTPFAVGQAAAGGLFIVSLPRLVGQMPILDLLHPQPIDFNPLLAMSGTAIMEMIMLYGICIGIRVQTRSGEGQAGLAHSALRTWQANFGLGAASLIVLPFALNSELDDIALLLVGLSLGTFLAALWVIALVLRAGRRPRLEGGGRADGGSGRSDGSVDNSRGSLDDHSEGPNESL